MKQVSNLPDMFVTDCGATYFTDEKIRTELKRRDPTNVDVDLLSFGEIDLTGSSHEQSLRNDLEFLKTSRYIRKELAERTKGFLYDIKTGEVHEVAA